jgi:hypothetical protein
VRPCSFFPYMYPKFDDLEGPRLRIGTSCSAIQTASMPGVGIATHLRRRLSTRAPIVRVEKSRRVPLGVTSNTVSEPKMPLAWVSHRGPWKVPKKMRVIRFIVA